MATLIAVYTSSGLVGRCDAKCYNADSPDCDCICGGMNHGAGQDKAVENTREQVEEWLESYAKEKRLTQYRAVLNRPLVDQISLFNSGNSIQSIAREDQP